MIGTRISNSLGELIKPLRQEMRLAQEQTLERIQKVIFKAETEVAQEGRFMSQEQRLKEATKELEKAEEQLLSALGSITKALSYIAPQSNLFVHFSPIKDIKGQVIDQAQDSPSKPKLNFLNWKKQS